MNSQIKYLTRLFSATALIFVSHAAHAQNLVLNPSFEEYEICPNMPNPYLEVHIANWDITISADYFNTCSDNPVLSPPDIVYGYQMPKDGEAYAGIFFVRPEQEGCCEYLIGRLSEPLEKDSFYRVRIYISFAEQSSYACDCIQVLLSEEYHYTYETFGQIYATPQLYTTEILQDTASWRELCWIYQANGGEHFITIGNFLQDSEVNYIAWEGIYGIAYYFIDLVSVEKIPYSLFNPGFADHDTVCWSDFPLELSLEGLAYDNFLWSTGDTTSTLQITEGGEYTVLAIADGCVLYDTIEIEEIAALSLSLPEDTVLCKEEHLILSAGDGFDAYVWSTGDNTAAVVLQEAGEYSVEARYRCDTLDATVSVSLAPDLNLNLTRDHAINLGDSILLEPSSSNPLANYHWLPQTDLSCPSCVTTMASPKHDTYYQLYVEDIYGCRDTIGTFLSVKNPRRIFVPTAFSPNGDGVNDVFAPYAAVEVKRISYLRIFDRWGNEVYRQQELPLDGSNGWNGNSTSGEPLNGGVYVYLMHIEYLNGSYELLSGEVVLVR